MFFSVQQDHYFFFKGPVPFGIGKSTQKFDYAYNVLFLKESK